MKVDLKVKEDKKALALERELNKLLELSWKAPIIPLEKPYQNGWIKFYVLRDDYTRRTDTNVYLRILKEVGIERFSRNKNFLDKNGRPLTPGLKIIGKNEWDKLGWPEHYKKYFYYGLHPVETRWGTGGTREGYKLTHTFYLVEAIRPHMVTHTKVIYPDVQKRIREIYNTFEHKQYWSRLWHLKGQKMSYDKKDYNQEIHRFKSSLGLKDVEEYDQ